MNAQRWTGDDGVNGDPHETLRNVLWPPPPSCGGAEAGLHCEVSRANRRVDGRVDGRVAADLSPLSRLPEPPRSSGSAGSLIHVTTATPGGCFLAVHVQGKTMATHLHFPKPPRGSLREAGKGAGKACAPQTVQARPLAPGSRARPRRGRRQTREPNPEPLRKVTHGGP